MGLDLYMVAAMIHAAKSPAETDEEIIEEVMTHMHSRTFRAYTWQDIPPEQRIEVLAAIRDLREVHQR